MNKPFQRLIYIALTASEGELFFIILKYFQPLFNVASSSVLVVVGVLYLPLHFIIFAVIIIAVIIITFIVNIIFIISIIIRVFIKSSLLFLLDIFLIGDVEDTLTPT